MFAIEYIHLHQLVFPSLSISWQKKKEKKTETQGINSRGSYGVNELRVTAVIIAADAVTPATAIAVIVVAAAIVVVVGVERTDLYSLKTTTNAYLCARGTYGQCSSPSRSLGGERADVRRGWRGEDRMCVCIREEGRQTMRRVWKSAGPCETRRRRRRNERTEKAEEDASVYRTRRRVRVGGRRQYCDQTKQKNVRVPIVLGAPPRYAYVVRPNATLHAYRHRW